MKKMKNYLLAGAFLVLLGIQPAQAAGPFGLGLIMGDPGGVSFKYWMDHRNSFEGIVGLGFGRGGNFSVGMDWTHHWSDLTPVREGRFLLGLGGGAMIGVGNNVGLAVRGKGVMDYTFGEVPINIFLEMGPTLYFMSPGFGVTGGIGFRWFF